MTIHLTSALNKIVGAKISWLFLLLTVSVLFSGVCRAQIKKPVSVSSSVNSVNVLRSTAAYAEILLRRADLEADLEDLLVGYTEDYQKVKSTRYELSLINASMEKILAVNVSESAKLTSALGKLLVRKAELETDLWNLKIRLGDEHPDVKRAARKVAVFDKAVKEILP